MIRGRILQAALCGSSRESVVAESVSFFGLGEMVCLWDSSSVSLVWKRSLK